VACALPAHRPRCLLRYGDALAHAALAGSCSRSLRAHGQQGDSAGARVTAVPWRGVRVRVGGGGARPRPALAPARTGPAVAHSAPQLTRLCRICGIIVVRCGGVGVRGRVLGLLGSAGSLRRRHPPAQPQQQVQRGLLLDVVVGQRAAVLQLLAPEKQALLVGRDALLVLNVSLHVLCSWRASGRTRGCHAGCQ